MLSKQGRESGLNEFSVPLTDPSGIKGWQAVDGGMYYLTGDGKLHFLRRGEEGRVRIGVRNSAFGVRDWFSKAECREPNAESHCSPNVIRL